MKTCMGMGQHRGGPKVKIQTISIWVGLWVIFFLFSNWQMLPNVVMIILTSRKAFKKKSKLLSQNQKVKEEEDKIILYL